MKSEPVLFLESVSLRRGRTAAVSDLSLEVGAGRICGLLGPDGAGKTSTLSLMSGLLTPDHGRIGGTAATSRRIGAVIGRRGTHPRRTALDHIRIAAAILGVDRPECAAVLAGVGLAERANTRAGELSTVETLRLRIAVACLGAPEIVILDEPFAVLDAETTAWLADFLRDRRSAGTAMLISSRLLKEIGGLADEIYILGRGRLVASGSSERLREKFDFSWIAVDVEDPQRLATALAGRGGELFDAPGTERVRVAGLNREQVESAAAEAGLSITALRVVHEMNDDYVHLTGAPAHLAEVRGEEL